MTNFNLREKRKGIIKEILKSFPYEFNNSMNSVKQIHKETELIDDILRMVEKQDKEFIRLLKSIIDINELLDVKKDLKKEVDELTGYK